MSWILILVLYAHDGSIYKTKEVMKVPSKDECVSRGTHFEQYYSQRGLLVKHICVVPI